MSTESLNLLENNRIFFYIKPIKYQWVTKTKTIGPKRGVLDGLNWGIQRHTTAYNGIQRHTTAYLGIKKCVFLIQILFKTGNEEGKRGMKRENGEWRVFWFFKKMSFLEKLNNLRGMTEKVTFLSLGTDWLNLENIFFNLVFSRHKCTFLMVFFRERPSADCCFLCHLAIPGCYR